MSVFVGDIDMFKEFKELVVEEGLLGRFLLIRRPLPGVKGRSEFGEPSTDRPEEYGRNLLWYEVPAYAYSAPYAFNKDKIATRFDQISQVSHVFYFPGDFVVTDRDIVIEPERDDSGKIVLPVVRRFYYQVQSVETYSSVRGKPEFFAAYARDVTREHRQAPGEEGHT